MVTVLKFKLYLSGGKKLEHVFDPSVHWVWNLVDIYRSVRLYDH